MERDMEICNIGQGGNYANVSQVLLLLDRYLCPFGPLHPRHALVDIATAASAWDSHNGVLHTVRIMDGRLDCHIDSAVGPGRGEWEL